MRAAARADRSYNKAVEQIDVVTGEIVATFPSQSDAEVRPNEQTERARAKERERERERERAGREGSRRGNRRFICTPSYVHAVLPLDLATCPNSCPM